MTLILLTAMWRHNRHYSN